MNETQWAELIAECRSSGIGAKLWCQQRNIKYGSYAYQVKKLKKQQTKWVQVKTASNKVLDTKANSTDPAEILLCCGKWTLTVKPGTSVEQLTNVLKAVDAL
jgi:hypothetical protein